MDVINLAEWVFKLKRVAVSNRVGIGASSTAGVQEISHVTNNWHMLLIPSQF
jgi:hypothetical protein